MIVISVENLFHDNKIPGNTKEKFKEFQVNHKMAVRNCTPESKLKIGRIIAWPGKLQYRFQVVSDISKIYADQITTIRSKISSANETNSEESDTLNYRSKNRVA